METVTVTGILFGLVGVLIIFLFIYWFIVHPIRCELVLRKFENDLRIGDRFLSKMTLSDNPFDEFYGRSIMIEILDMKPNQFGQLFIKVIYDDGSISIMTLDKLYNDFTKIKK